MTEHGHIRPDVQSEAVHGPLPAVTSPDGADLARVRAGRIDPDAREPVEPAHVG